MPDIYQFLEAMFHEGASDLHLTTGSPPQVRVDGKIRALSYAAFSGSDTGEMATCILNEEQKKKLEKYHEIDISFGINGLSRFRANIFYQRGAIAMAIRCIPFIIPSFEELGLPPIIAELCEKPHGMILVTGPTGSGKSTTLAAMIDRINNTHNKHIITVEDPIEYLYSHGKCIVNQREVHTDTPSFHTALRSVLREDPDIILIGEMRDLETIEAALTLSETGHLTLATLHTDSCYQSINRIINVFPPHQQNQVRLQLSFVLQGIISQQLIPKKDGIGRVLALEILIPNAAVRNLIRENQIHQIYSMIQAGQSKHNMQSMNQSLFDLFLKGKISEESALVRSNFSEELKQWIQRKENKFY
ncbi:MAG: type IV pilus twitching motility protein PilT [bacterium]